MTDNTTWAHHKTIKKQSTEIERPYKANTRRIMMTKEDPTEVNVDQF